MIVGSGWMGSWMMGGRYGLAGDGKPVQSLAAANTRAQAFADRLGLRVGEVMQFSSNYYAELVTAAGRGATEILVDPGNGAVSLECGPAMMWNSQYGIHPSATSQVRVSPSQAREIADTWLRDQRLYDAFATSGKALASGKRLELLDLLAQSERTVDALAKAAGLNLTTASAHLQTLKQAGLVATRREGVRIHYRLAGDDVARLFALLRTIADRHQAAVPAARDAYLGDDGAMEITREELRARAAGGDVVVLDVRPVEEYHAGHIPGALSIPTTELADRISELPETTDIVVYCRGEYCVLAYDAVRLLTSQGRRAIRLNDGMLEWRLAELPVEAGTSGIHLPGVREM